MAYRGHGGVSIDNALYLGSVVDNGSSFMTTNLDEVLGALNKVGWQIDKDARRTAEDIADEIMVPAFERAMIRSAGNYAPKLIRSMKTRVDRIPSVKIGNNAKFKTRNTKAPMAPSFREKNLSGGASTNMIRFGTIKGGYVSRGGKYQFWADSVAGDWTTQAEADYYEPAWNKWTESVNKLVDDWNRGRDY